MLKVNFFMSDETNKIKKYYIFLSIVYYVLDLALFVIIGLTEKSDADLITASILFIWLLGCLILFNLITLKKLNIFIYSILLAILGMGEEVLVYYNGGGLNGTATSLQQDLLLVIPVFAGLGITLYISAIFFDLVASDFYVYGSIYGWLLELVIGGKLIYFYLFGGPALVIYGSMLAVFAPKIPRRNSKLHIHKVLEILFILVLMFIGMITGAIVGGMIYSLVK